MAVHYKFKSAKDYDSVAIDGHFISVGNLKEKIFELKHLGRGTDFDLVVTNAQTNEEYLDEGMLIPKNTSVLIRRVPGRPRKPIVTAPVTEQEESNMENNFDDVQDVNSGFAGADPSAVKYAEDSEWDEFGNDLYAIPETVSIQSSVPVRDGPPVSKEDEDSKIKALIDTPALDWQRQPPDSFGPGRGFGRGMGGRMTGGRGFGRGGFEKKTPPAGYICHRCKVPGHFIQHCATNGDPTFDIKRVKPPTGIPKSMLMATPDGSYALPSGAVAVLKPNEAAFDKEIEGMPSTRSVGDLPPELHCPLCKEVMKDAVLTSKCCFTSFCDKCIRDHIISKSMCTCGATNVLADDLLPNKTLRDTINRILESNNSSAEMGGSAYQAQDMESRNPQAKVPTPTQSAASKGHQVATPPPQRQDTPKIAETVEENKFSNAPVEPEKGRTPKVPDVSEVTHDSRTVKEATSQGSALIADDEVQQKPLSGEAGKKKKKKKTRLPPGAPDMQWRTGQELAPENYMMPLGPSTFNPYWNGMQPGFDGFMPPFGGPMPYMGYGLSPMDVAFGGVMPQDPFGGPGCMFPYGPPPHRDLAELAMGFNAGLPPPIMSREEFEARNMKRKREMERRGEREMIKDREYGREGSSSVNVPPMKSKHKSIPPPQSSSNYHHRSERYSPDRRPEPARTSSKKKSSDYDDQDDDHHYQHRPSELPRPSKKKSEYDHQDDRRDEKHRHRDRDQDLRSRHHRRSESPSELPAPEPVSSASAADKKLKGSVFSRISFPEGEDPSAQKKMKVASSSDAPPPAGSSSHHCVSSTLPNGYHHKEDHKTVTMSRKGASALAAAASVDQDSSDDERHFKRRPSRYNSSPPPAAASMEEDESRHSRGSRGDRDRGSLSKHR